MQTKLRKQPARVNYAKRRQNKVTVWEKNTSKTQAEGTACVGSSEFVWKRCTRIGYIFVCTWWLPSKEGERIRTRAVQLQEKKKNGKSSSFFFKKQASGFPPHRTLWHGCSTGSCLFYSVFGRETLHPPFVTGRSFKAVSFFFTDI